MSPAPGRTASRLTKPRPGHADLTGMQKYDRIDARDILERASARETAARVAAGAIAKALLRRIGAEVISHVVQHRRGRRGRRTAGPRVARPRRRRRLRRCAASTPTPRRR